MSPRKPSAKKTTHNLSEYARKRDFKVTPEPPPGPASRPAAASTFMVHKHHARRLHYDLRLEMDGALASWAVPKGPSYDPAVKRLAVQTEDHPLDYGDFEGRIPDGEYGAGDSIIWDRGTFETDPPGQASAQRKKGHLKLVLQGDKLHGAWHLVRTRREEGGKAQWLLFKAHDGTERSDYDVVSERPESVVSGRRETRGPAHKSLAPQSPARLVERFLPPMLATATDEMPRDPAAFHYEVKYDGFRALVGCSRGMVAMRSRRGEDLAPRFPEIAKAFAALQVGEAVIDGEIVALDAKGVARFGLLQQGHSRLACICFDLVWLEGKDLRQVPIEGRRDLLESLLAGAPAGLRLSERITDPPEQALAHLARKGAEGMVAKRRGSRYENRRSRDWLKLKAFAGQELGILGFTDLEGAKGLVGALLLGVAEQGKLVYAGKVGTGFSTAERRRLYGLLSPDEVGRAKADKVPRMRDVHFVEPRLVAQVRFAEWTSDGRLRHPIYAGLREDKSPLECVREPAEVDPPAPPKVTLTHSDRLVYPRDGITKQQVKDYFHAVSGPILAALAERPVAFERWPKGIEGSSWFQQNMHQDEKPWMSLVETPTSTARGAARHLIVDSLDALDWIAQHSALTIHMWLSRRGSLESPDWVVFDLDPAEGRGIEQAVEAALALRRLFDQLGLPSVPKTTGKRGLHLLVPLAPGQSYGDAVDFARRVGAAIARLIPSITVERAKNRRKGRLYLDCVQNGYGKTIVAPYSLRGLPGAPVSAPLSWNEVVQGLDPLRYTLKTMPKRLDRLGDLFAPALSRGVKLPRFR